MTPKASRRDPLSVTVNDVARVAGVSAMTVSRVMNRPEIVPAETVAKVRAAVEATGYVPNGLSRGLRSSRSHLIAALVPTLSGPVYLDTVEALTESLVRRGYQLIVGQTGYTAAGEDALLSDIIGRRPDGIVLTGVLHSAEARKRLLAARIPVIETWDLTNEPVDMLIGFSHEAVGASVADHLHRKGRRRFAFIGADDTRSYRRWRAFAERAVALGLVKPVAHFVPAPARLGDGRKAMRAVIASSPEVDGLFCSSDLVANGAFIECRAAGIDIPRQLGVVGFGDLNFARDLDPALTTVRIDGLRIGEAAADLIVRRARREEVTERVIDVGFEVVDRASA